MGWIFFFLWCAGAFADDYAKNFDEITDAQESDGSPSQGDPPSLDESVDQIDVLGHRQETRVVLTFSSPVSLTPTMLGETVVIPLPSTLNWNAEKSLPFPKGLVKNFSVKNGNLEIFLFPGTAMTKVVSDHVHPGLTLTFNPGDPTAPFDTQVIEPVLTPPVQKGYQIKNIRIGLSGANQARVVFDLDKGATLNPLQKGHKIIIPLNQGDLMGEMKIKQMGLVTNMTVTTQNGVKVIEIHLKPGTKLVKHFGLSGDKPRYVIDLSNEDIPTSAESETDLTVGGDTTIAVPPLLQSLSIGTQDQATCLTLAMGSDDVSIDVTENSYTHQVLVHLPKIDWEGVQALQQNGGVIKNYFVDQSSPDGTVLVLTIDENATVLSKKQEGNNFILLLGKDADQKPWGQDSLFGDTLSQHKNIFGYQSQRPVVLTESPFQGGNAPFSDVGTGLYGGANVSYTVATNHMNQAGNSVKESLSGVGGGLLIGYGLGLGRGMIGAEGLIHWINADFDNDRLKYSYGLALRGGLYATPDSLVFVRVGARGSIFHSRDLRQNTAGIFYGVGIETALNTHWSIRTDYTHTNDQHFTQNTRRIALQQDQVTMGVSYKYDPMFGPDSPIDVAEVPFGLYVGTGMGMASLVMNRPQSSSSTQTPLWQLMVGYGVQYNKIYVGLETTLTLGNQLINQTVNTQKTLDQLQNGIDFHVRSGWGFGHGNLLYGKIGCGIASYTQEQTVKTTRQLFGWSVGAGLESFITNTLSVRGEYLFDFYQSFDPKISVSKFQLGMNYLI